MSKKDYIAVANMLHDELDYSLEQASETENPAGAATFYGQAEGIRIVASKLCDYFNETNPRFSERQFMDAVGIDHKSARV